MACSTVRSAESKEIQLVGYRHLAELYWEMIYAGLAQGDLRTHALNQSLSNANSALALAGKDTGLLFLKGRVLLELSQYSESKKIMELAMSYGLPESRALPYIVETAFYQHDYVAVQELLSRLSAYRLTRIMENAIQFWVKQPTVHRDSLAKESGV